MQFSLLALVALTVAACLLVIWFSRPPRVRIITHLFEAEVLESDTERNPDEGKAPKSPPLDEVVRLIKSDGFAQSVVSDPTISGLKIIKDEKAPANWLRAQLTVGFDDDLKVPIASITLRASQEQEGRLLIEQVAREYLTRRVFADSEAAQKRRIEIEAQYEEVSRELRAKISEYDDLIRDRGADVPESIDLIRELEIAQRRTSDLSIELETIDSKDAAPSRIRIQTAVTVVQLGRW